MKIAVLISRVLLGILFIVSGAFGFAFLFMAPPPPPPGLAGIFFHAYSDSHWLQWVAGIQFIAGVLLIVNRYVSLALILIGALLYNILVFHITMNISGIFPGLVCLALWVMVAQQHHGFFKYLFSEKPDLN